MMKANSFSRCVDGGEATCNSIRYKLKSQYSIRFDARKEIKSNERTGKNALMNDVNIDRVLNSVAGDQDLKKVSYKNFKIYKFLFT